MHRPLLLVFSLITALASCRPTRNHQSAAIKTVRSTPWETKTLATGLTWQHYSFPSLFDTIENINILDLDLSSGSARPQIIYDPHELKPTHELAFNAPAKTHALAAVNGNFFHMQEGGSVCFLKIDGKIIDTSRTTLPPKYFLDELDDAAFTIATDGSVAIRLCPPGGWKSLESIPTILSGGPPLLINKQAIPLIQHSFNDKRHGRTGIGLTAKNHLLIITVDGRSPHSCGATLNEFRTLFEAFHCANAMNLDGGGSTTMYIAGQPFDGIVNYPTDNKKYDHTGERKVANILAIVQKEQ